MLRSKVITILLLITIICLGLSLLLMPRRDALAVRPEPLMPFPPSGVTEVTLTTGNSPRQRLVRETTDRWVLHLGGQPEIVWPIGADRVRAFLRILDRLRGMPRERAAPGEGARFGGSSLEVTGADGEAITLGLPRGGRGLLGGRAVVTLERSGSADGARSFLTTDELPRLLGEQGFLAWIDARVFAGIEGEITRVQIVSEGNGGGNALVLGRKRGGWRIESPFDEPAEDELVDELVRGLQLLPVAEGRDGRAELLEWAGHATDATEISLTAQQRASQADGTVTSRSLVHRCVTLGPVSNGGRVPVLLGAVEANGTARPGMDEPMLFGPIAASVDATRLTELVRQPAFYLARRALRAEPSDVRALVVALPSGVEVRVEREGEGWVRNGERVGTEESSAIESLVETMTVGVAAVAAWSEAGAAPGSRPLATVACEGFGGLTLETVKFGVAGLPAPAEDTRLHVLLTVGNVLRYYTPNPGVGSATAWIAGLGTDGGAGSEPSGL